MWSCRAWSKGWPYRNISSNYPRTLESFRSNGRDYLPHITRWSLFRCQEVVLCRVSSAFSGKSLCCTEIKPNLLYYIVYFFCACIAFFLLAFVNFYRRIKIAFPGLVFISSFIYNLHSIQYMRTINVLTLSSSSEMHESYGGVLYLTLSLFTCLSGYKCPNYISAKQAEKCYSEDRSANQLQVGRRTLGIGHSTGKRGYWFCRLAGLTLVLGLGGFA